MDKKKKNFYFYFDQVVKIIKTFFQMPKELYLENQSNLMIERNLGV